MITRQIVCDKFQIINILIAFHYFTFLTRHFLVYHLSPVCLFQTLLINWVSYHNLLVCVSVGLSVKDFTITVGNNSDAMSSDNERCIHKCGTFGRGRREVFHCLRRIRGKYVTFIIDHDDSSVLRLTEIEVFKWDSKSLNLNFNSALLDNQVTVRFLSEWCNSVSINPNITFWSQNIRKSIIVHW